MSVFSFVKRHSSQLMSGFMVVMLCLLAFAPFISSYTKQAVQMYWLAIVETGFGWTLPAALIILVLGVAMNEKLSSLNKRWLEWSPFNKKANAIYSPIERKWSGWVYVAVLAYCMPLMALVEEIIFRHMISQMSLIIMVLISGPIFGFVHLTSGVTVRMSIYISLVGLVMAATYALSGLAGAFVLHTSYNLIAISWVVFSLRIRQPLGILLVRYELTRRQLPTITTWLVKPQQPAAIN